MATYNTNQYDRLFVALLTPFKDNMEVDEPALRRLIRHFAQPKFVDSGGGVIINPEAGEIFCLSREEKRRSVEIAMEEVGGRMPVFAGVGEVRTEAAVKVARDAREVGVDGLFLMPPMGSLDITVAWDTDKYPEVFVDFVQAELKEADLPAIVHPVGSVSPLYGVGFPLNATLHICRHVPNIVGWKMTYTYPGSIIIAKALRKFDRHIGILRSTARFFHENLATDMFDGTVSGSWNYAMEPMVDHINAWRRKDFDDAWRIWSSGLSELHDWVYSEMSRLHVRYKCTTWLTGLIPSPFMRPPMPKPRMEEITKARELLAAAHMNVIPDKEIKAVLAKL